MLVASIEANGSSPVTRFFKNNKVVGLAVVCGILGALLAIGALWRPMRSAGHISASLKAQITQRDQLRAGSGNPSAEELPDASDSKDVRLAEIRSLRKKCIKLDDRKRLVQLCRLAIRAGSAEALFILADAAEKPIFKSLLGNEDIYSLYSQAAELGYPAAYAELARLALEGRLTREDIPNAKRFLKMANDANVPDAGFYDAIVGIKSNMPANDVVATLESAVKKGSAKAMEYLANLYAEGRLVEKNEKLSESYLQQAAATGSAAGEFEYSKYIIASSSATDAERAVAFDALLDSSEQGYGPANEYVARYLARASASSSTDWQIIRQYAEAAADAGRSEGALLMAYSYSRENATKSADWLQIAARLGSAQAAFAQLLVSQGASKSYYDAITTARASTYAERSMMSLQQSTPEPGASRMAIPLQITSPEFPSQLRGLRIDTLIDVSVFINEQGRVTRVDIEEGDNPLFSTAVEKSVTAWRFSPATKDGKPVPARLTIPVRFHSE